MIFANAKVAAKPSKAPSRKAKKDEVKLDGIRDTAALDLVIKTLCTLKSTLDTDIKSAMKVIFNKHGFETGKRLDNFNGTDGASSASCQLRSKSTSARIPDADLAVLQKYGISVDAVPDQIETFIINPAYLGDAKLLEKVSKAIGGVAGIPDDFIQKQEATIKHTLTGTSLAEVYALAERNEKGQRRVTPEELNQLVDIVATLAITPKFGSDDVVEAFKVIEGLVPGLTPKVDTEKKVTAASAPDLAAALHASVALASQKSDVANKAPARKSVARKAA